MHPMKSLPFSEAANCNKYPIYEKLRIFLPPPPQPSININNNNLNNNNNKIRLLEIGSGTGQHCAFFTSKIPYLQWQCTDINNNMINGIEMVLEEERLSRTEGNKNNNLNNNNNNNINNINWQLPAVQLLDVLEVKSRDVNINNINNNSNNNNVTSIWQFIRDQLKKKCDEKAVIIKDENSSKYNNNLNNDNNNNINYHNYFDVFFTANVFHIMPWEGVVAFFDVIIANLAPYNNNNNNNNNNRIVKLIFYGAFKYNGNFTTESNEHFDKCLKRRDPRSGVRDFEDICLLANKYGFRLVEDANMPENNQLLMFQRP